MASSVVEALPVLIADRGYARARELRAGLDPSGPHGRDFIVHIGWKALAPRDAQGEPFNLIAYLPAMATDAGPQECPVQAVVGSAKQPVLLPMQLIAVPLPADKAEASRKELKRRASMQQDKFEGEAPPAG